MISCTDWELSSLRTIVYLLLLCPALLQLHRPRFPELLQRFSINVFFKILFCPGEQESKQASKVAPVATKVEDPAKVKQEPKVRKVGQEVTEVGRMNEELLRALREEDVDRALEIKKKYVPVRC